MLFREQIRKAFDPAVPTTLWECAPGLRRFVAEGLIQEWVNAELQLLTGDNNYIGNWTANEVVLHRDPTCALSLTLFDAPQRYIHVLPFIGLYIPLLDGLGCDRYEIPKDLRSDVFDPSMRLHPAGSLSITAGDTLNIESERYAYDWKVSKPVVVLRLTTTCLRSLEWLFSKTTLQAWQANDADLAFTQLRVAAHVVGKIAHQSSVGPLRQLSEHPHHAVRWAAIQNLGRLSRSDAIVKIREAVQDPHPHVRRAAQKTLDRLENRSNKAT